MKAIQGRIVDAEKGKMEILLVKAPVGVLEIKVDVVAEEEVMVVVGVEIVEDKALQETVGVVPRRSSSLLTSNAIPDTSSTLDCIHTKGRRGQGDYINIIP